MGGGSEATCRLLGLEEQLAKRRVRLSDSQKESLYRMYLTGESAEDLAATYDISVASVYKHIKTQRDREGSMAQAERVIAGDKTNGRLVVTDTARHRFDGTHLTADGEMHRWKFTATGQRMAVQQYEKWCKALDDECEFVRKVERKDEPSTDQPEEPEAVCGHPGDPIEEIRPIQAVEPAPVPEVSVRPWREVAEERQAEIDRLTSELAEARGFCERLEDAASRGEPVELWGVGYAKGAPSVGTPVYVVWAKGESPRIYGAFDSMERALEELDRLNDVAAFLGSANVFEVEEVQWRM